jgi:hypothetical protein
MHGGVRFRTPLCGDNIGAVALAPENVKAKFHFSLQGEMIRLWRLGSRVLSGLWLRLAHLLENLDLEELVI